MPIGKNSIKRAAKAVEAPAPEKKACKAAPAVTTSVIGAISPEVVEKVIKPKAPAKKAQKKKTAAKAAAPQKAVKIKENHAKKTPAVAIGEELPTYLL